MAYKGIKGTVNGIRNMLDTLEGQGDKLWEQHLKDQRVKTSAYQDGADDMLTAVKRIRGGEIPFDIFGVPDEMTGLNGWQNPTNIGVDMSASEILEKIRAYDESKDKTGYIRVDHVPERCSECPYCCFAGLIKSERVCVFTLTRHEGEGRSDDCPIVLE